MITAEVVLRELHEIAAERKKALGIDYVYQMPTPPLVGMTPVCAYVDAGTPSCLIGVWLYRYHNVSLETLDDHNNDGFADFYDYLDLELEDLALSVAATAQDKQDMGVPWLRAVAEVADEFEIELETT